VRDRAIARVMRVTSIFQDNRAGTWSFHAYGYLKAVSRQCLPCGDVSRGILSAGMLGVAIAVEGSRRRPLSSVPLATID
jgi:hypothetical protein